MEKQNFEKLPAEYRADLLKSQESIFFNTALFEQCQRVAQMFAQSTMVPKDFQGNIGNCMIALNYASRLRADPFMVFQTLYTVHGRPGVEGKLVEACINQSGKYSEPLDYEWLDPEDKATTRNQVLKSKEDGWGCQACTIDKASGKRVIGPKITWQIVKDEGWYDKNGPDGTVKSNKWRTMPEMMFYYRAASWFANKNCPEVKLGMATKEEIEDMTIDVEPVRPKRKEDPIDYGPIDSEKVKAFDESVPDKADKKLLDEFIENCANHFKKSVERFKADVIEASEFDKFWQAYEGWKAKRPKPKENEANPWKVFKKSWIDLTKVGFKPFVEKHLKQFKEVPEEIRQSAKEKWVRFYQEPWPLDAKEAEHIPPRGMDNDRLDDYGHSDDEKKWREQCDFYLGELGVKVFTDVLDSLHAKTPEDLPDIQRVTFLKRLKAKLEERDSK